jgi:pteridine reductase
MTEPAIAKPAPVLLITGAAQRLGASIATLFHQRGYGIAIHYHRSGSAARQLASELCQQRPDSAITLCAALGDTAAVAALPDAVIRHFGRLDVLVNNASAFYPTPWQQASEQQWNELMDSNLKGPFFLSQACLPALRRTQGCIINMIDIHAERPLPEHPLYCMAKAGLAMMTKALATDSGVRSNGLAPGAILWPDGDTMTSVEKADILAKIPLGRMGDTDDIARSVWFLANDAPYINGQIISVDGGRSQVS